MSDDFVIPVSAVFCLFVCFFGKRKKRNGTSKEHFSSISHTYTVQAHKVTPNNLTEVENLLKDAIK